MTIRFCSRCGHELTDAVSKDLGIGPICRMIDNAVYANSIPADLATAQSILSAFDLTVAAPETQPTLATVLCTVTEGAITDWRKTVNRLDWCCSYAQPAAVRASMLSIMRALGYVGLAAIIDGSASTGEVKVWGAAGRIYVKGSKNAAGAAAFKLIAGWSFHGSKSGATGDTLNAWSFPAAKVEAVKLATITYYPAVSCDWNAVADDAKVGTPAIVAATPKAVVLGAACKVTTVGGKLHVSTPYSAAFVEALKAAIDWTDRKWNTALKVWEVKATHKATVEALIAKHYPSASAAAAVV